MKTPDLHGVEPSTRSHMKAPSGILMRGFCRLTLLLAAGAGAEPWALAGTVRDAEDGSRVKKVVVTLAQARLIDTTDKEGRWSLGNQVGVRSRIRTPNGIDPSLSFLSGHLQLRLDGHDLQGRRLPHPVDAASRTMASRAAATESDTLIFSKDGFTTKRVPVFATTQTGRTDSIRRIRYAGWVDSSHANLKADSSAGFFPGARTMTIRWSKASWDRMMKVMSDSCGAFGTRGQGWTTTTSKVCSDGQNDYIEKSAMVWVPADIETDGQVWKDVGIRLKGNWSLQEAWTSGNYALPFRFVSPR